MSYANLLVEKSLHAVRLTFHRPQRQNSINLELLAEINQVLDEAEQTPDCKIVILQGEEGIFCTGMDFRELTETMIGPDNQIQATEPFVLFMSLLKRLTTIPKVIIANLDGKVIAGGVGFVAASDLVIATERTQFSLSEALWGLLPASVIPFLIRRVGFQKAYFLTLTMQTVSALEAQKFNLVDEIAENPEELMRRKILRLTRLDAETIADLKAYFGKMWQISEETEQLAVQEIVRLVSKPRVQANIRDYILYQKFPWESRP